MVKNNGWCATQSIAFPSLFAVLILTISVSMMPTSAQAAPASFVIEAGEVEKSKAKKQQARSLKLNKQEDKYKSDKKKKNKDRGSSSSGSPGAQAMPAPRLLVLYDAPTGAPMRKLGLAYAIMLRNLLGHFAAQVTLRPVDQYSAGELASFDGAFYLGNYYDNPIPTAFLNDASSTQKLVVWFKYNIWQLFFPADFGMRAKTGLAFSALRGFDTAPSPENPSPGFFDTVEYGGEELIKFYDFDSASLTVKADPDIGVMQIVDPLKAQSIVEISNSQSGERVPYIVQAGSFWYVADIPFSFIGPRDRYLAFCDVLHDILGIDHPVNHRALVRLEDVAALINGNSMDKLTKYLDKEKIPFSIALVPVYRDPFGHYNGGVPQEIHLAEASTLRAALDKALKRGGELLLHGYSHQYNNERNPFTGVTADDFEFWNVGTNSPVVEDSIAWALGRIDAGIAELSASGYMPYTFEVPHYQASPLAYQASGQRFDSRYERSFYYTATQPRLNLGVNDPERDFAVGQFFPYEIHADHYGQKVIPENLGNIEYDIREIDPLSTVEHTWEDLVINARYALIVRDGYASFFFHPFWLDPDLPVDGFNDFKRLAEGITALGYRWSSGRTVLQEMRQ